MNEWLGWLLNVITVIVGFGVLIFVHEFGHFILAKWKGVKVIKFSLGFGPALLHFTKGETEYALSAVPLGGYCKLAGEFSGDKEEASDEPPTPADRLLGAKSVGARAQIFVAGAVMNLILAFPLGIAMVLIGGYEPITKVNVGIGKAFEAGVHTGDMVTSIDGKPVRYFIEMQKAIADIPPKTPFSLTVKRDASGSQSIEKTYRVQRQDKNDFLGLQPYFDRKLWFVHPKGRAHKAGFKARDEILSITKGENDTIHISDWQDFQSAISASPKEKLTVEVRRESSDRNVEYITLTKTVTPDAEESYGIGAQLSERPVIAALQGESPAVDAGLRAGDRIIQVGETPVSSWREILGAIRNAGRSVPIMLLRNGKEIEVVVNRPTEKDLIGIAPPDSPLLIVSVAAGSPAQQAGLVPGDEIVKVDDQEVSCLAERYAGLLPDSKERTLTIRRGDEQFSVVVKPVVTSIGKIGVAPMPVSEFRRPPSFFAAISEGTERTILLYSQTFKVLFGLFVGRVSTSELSGPVGIVTLSYAAVESGWQDFVRFMMMITVSLGVFNLLPVPVLDGGHLLFLLIEKIKGKPVSERTLVVAQYVGLVLLIGLVLYVTHNDVMGIIL